MQLYLPQGRYRDLILQECHDSYYAGHLGVRKTMELTQRGFYWPTIQQDVTTYVQTCEECQRNKSSNQRPTRLLQPLEILGHHWEKITIDFFPEVARKVCVPVGHNDPR